jgi:DNA invertase Pin-like site-specific DNA recombinase
LSRKAAVYLRQSIDRDQTKLAVARQGVDCLKLCEQRGWTPVEYVDNDVSASNGKVRPAYQAMLADIRDDEVGAVVAWDADRLHRQPRQLEDFIDLADAHKLALARVGGDFDLSTPTGRQRQNEGRVRADGDGAESRPPAPRRPAEGRTRSAAVETGLRLPGTNGPEPDPQTAPLVKQAYAAVLAGSSLKDSARLFNDAGAYGLNGKPWTQSTVSLFLREPRNAGLREYNGETVGKGTWTPLVDESAWRAAQSVMDAPGRGPGRKSVRRHLLTGVLQRGKPGCGGYLSEQWTTQKTIAYGCKQCRGVSIRAEHVEPLIYRVVSGRLAMPDAVDLVKAELHDTAEAETLLARLDEIADGRADGLLTGRQAQRATERINDKLAAIEKRQQDQERMRVFDGIPLGTPEAAAAVARLSPDRLRAVLDVLMTVTVAPVGKGRHVFNPERVQVNWR